MLRLPLFALLFAGLSAAQTPVITTIQNNYARIAEGEANYGIAQGSIFIVKGANLADTSTALQNPPLQTTLQNVKIRVSMGGNTYYVPLYYVLPTQLAAILPSNIPVGDGTLRVENKRQHQRGKASACGQERVRDAGLGL